MPGVYGPGEEIIVKRTYAYINSFISSFFVLHKKDLKIDWIHVRNVIQAQTKVNKSFTIADKNLEALNNHCKHVTNYTPLLFDFRQWRNCFFPIVTSQENYSTSQMEIQRAQILSLIL